MPDTVQKLLLSTIQHGPFNNRVYLMHLNRGDVPEIIPAMKRLADTKGYTKILARVPKSASEAFENAGYVQEVRIAGYYLDGEDQVFVSRYLSGAREKERHADIVARNESLIQGRPTPLKISETVTPCTTGETAEMAETFSQVFPSYPFPVTDPQYLAKAMNDNTRYFCIRKNRCIAAMAGCEMDTENRCVEMTDFAVLPRWRGRRFAACLLAAMEAEMKQAGMRIAFTIARTLSPGINLTFRNMDYRLGGKLVNNTQISGGIESMWVWYKQLKPELSY